MSNRTTENICIGLIYVYLTKKKCIYVCMNICMCIICTQYDRSPPRFHTAEKQIVVS